MYFMDFVGRRPFVSWLIFFALVVTGFAWLTHVGVVSMAIAADEFYVIRIIGLWFFGASLAVGSIAYNIDSSATLRHLGSKVYKRRLGFAWFTSSNLLNLGLAGTTYGFIAMLHNAFVGRDFSNAAVLPQLIPIVGQNWAAALFATASGITGTILLSVQAYIVDYSLRMNDGA